MGGSPGLLAEGKNGNLGGYSPGSLDDLGIKDSGFGPGKSRIFLIALDPPPGVESP